MACLTFCTGFYEPRVRRLRPAAFPPWPAGQFGVWEHSLNSQSDVIVCVWGGVDAYGSTPFPPENLGLCPA